MGCCQCSDNRVWGIVEMFGAGASWSSFDSFMMAMLLLFLLLGLLCHLLRKRKARLIKAVTRAVGVLLLMSVVLSIVLMGPDGTSPFELAFWRAVEFRSWQDTLRTLLISCLITLLGIRLNMEMKQRLSSNLECVPHRQTSKRRNKRRPV